MNVIENLTGRDSLIELFGISSSVPAAAFGSISSASFLRLPRSTMDLKASIAPTIFVLPDAFGPYITAEHNPLYAFLPACVFMTL
jgi:hypothetical protein